jgi:hypothetical protein
MLATVLAENSMMNIEFRTVDIGFPSPTTQNGFKIKVKTSIYPSKHAVQDLRTICIDMMKISVKHGHEFYCGGDKPGEGLIPLNLGDKDFASVNRFYDRNELKHGIVPAYKVFGINFHYQDKTQKYLYLIKGTEAISYDETSPVFEESDEAGGFFVVTLKSMKRDLLKNLKSITFTEEPYLTYGIYAMAYDKNESILKVWKEAIFGEINQIQLTERR